MTFLDGNRELGLSAFYHVYISSMSIMAFNYLTNPNSFLCSRYYEALAKKASLFFQDFSFTLIYLEPKPHVPNVETKVDQGYSFS